MPMRCPRCSTPPPFDPFLCTTCGEHLLTYLDEPLGPDSGVGVRTPGAGARTAGATIDPRTGEATGGLLPPGAEDGPAQGGAPGFQPPPSPPRRPDNTGPFILKLLLGLFFTMILMAEVPIGGFLFIGGLAFTLWRWPRARLLVFIPATIGMAAVALFSVELIEEAFDSPPSFIATPTPTPDRPATSTAIAIEGTPTLAPAARTANATVVAGENRVKLSRARARWLRGDNDAALAELDAALTLIPGQAETYNLRALVRISAGDHRGADDDSQRAVNAQPANLAYRDTRAYALLKLGQYGDAEGEYERVLAGSRTESRVAAYLGRGIARTALGKLAEARMDLETGLRLLPDTDPDPQVADLEIAARRSLDPLAPRPGSPSPAASPGVPGAPGPASPGGSPVPAATPEPAVAPATSPAARDPFNRPRVHPP